MELRAAFARDVNDCREMAPVRDERTLYNDNRANGLLRRALLDAGRRLKARGAVDDARDALWLPLDDAASALRAPESTTRTPGGGR